MSKTQKKHLRVSALLAGIVLCVGILMFFAQTASADKTANQSFTGSDPYNLNEYAREGSTVSLTKSLSTTDIDVCSQPDITCQNLVSGSPQIDFTCHGSGASLNGYWGAPAYSGVCWTSLDVCYFVGTINEYCEDYTTGNRNLISEPLNAPTISSSSLCSSPKKGVCDIESSGGFYYNQNSGGGDNISDAMFSIDPNTSLFVEFSALGGANATSYISRNGTGPTNRMMIPSSTSDFTRFLNNPPSSVTTEKACQTLRVEDYCTADLSAPAATINGVCGDIHTQTITYRPTADTGAGGPPTTELCSAGDDKTVNLVSNQYVWTCEGMGTPKGSDASCYADPTHGTCGSKHNQNYYTAPSNPNLCATGTATAVSTTATGWDWTCNSIPAGDGTTENCIANRNVDGVCGSANGVGAYSAPSSGLCSAGNPSAVTGTGPFNWTCVGLFDGTTANCSAPLRVDGVCRTYSGYSTTQPATNNATGCSAGTYADNTSNTASQWRWNCNGLNGGVNVPCTSARGTDGLCGTADGGSFDSAPSGGSLCNSGTATAVSGTGPWTWSCNGTGASPVNDNCSAALNCQVSPTGTKQNGTCGHAHGTTVASAGAITGSQRCLTGSGTAVSGSGPYTWTCNGINGGNPQSCSASALAGDPGTCGSAHGTTVSTAPSGSSLCNSGTATSVSGSGPWTWSCNGTGSQAGNNASCSANKVTTVNGLCGPADGGTYASTSAVNTAGRCNSGNPTTVSESGGLFNWTCNGMGSPVGSPDTCQATKATTINGACKPISGYYASEPATNSSNACNAGTFVDLSDTGTQWQWRCNGAGTPAGTNSPTCTANRATTINGACKPISGYYASEPATNSSNACNAGTFVDLSDTGTQWQWRCNGAGTPAGTNSPTCTANRATTVNGACKPYSGTHSSQPATNNSTGCNAGSYVNLSDTGTQWQWRCNGTGTPTGSNSPICVADKAPTGYWGGHPTTPFSIQYGTSPDIMMSQFDFDCGAIEPSACQGCTSFPAVICTPGAACDPSVDTGICLINQRSCSSPSIDATVWDRYRCTSTPGP